MTARKVAFIVAAALLVVCGITLMHAGAVPRIHSKDQSVASVNRRSISKQEFREYLGSSLGMKHSASALREVKDLENLLNDYMEYLMLIQDAERRGIMQHEDFLRAVQIGQNALLAQKFAGTVLKDTLAVTEADLRRFVPREWVQIRVRQVIVEEKKNAEAIRKKAKAGENFVELVRKHSIAPSARKDGDLGFKFPDSGFFSPADDRYLFSLAKGEISRVIETPLGFAVCKIEDKRTLSKQEIEDYTRKPKANIFNEKVQAHLEETRQSAGVKLYPDVLFECVRSMEAGVKQDGLIADAGDRKFFFSDLQRTLPRPYDMIFIDPPVEKLFDLYRDNLNAKINDFLLAQEAEILGVKLESEAEKSEMEKFRQMVALRMLGEQVLAGLAVTDAESKEYFSNNREAFDVPEKVRLWQIFLASESDAKFVMDKLKKGESFEKLAEQYSIDKQSKALSGFVGVLERKSIIPALADAAFSMRIGDFSKVIKSEAGYHIIMVSEKFPGKEFDFKQNSAKVKKTVLRKEQEEKFSEYVQGLNKQAAIDISDEALREMFAELQEQSTRRVN
ncbi:peptidylprolyl isomerase [Candidatus Poribacteria bacterium]|nr:peptidylprolyl isomerase [Candidatus Poribacteria bacterium]